ncbi:hypothetical protein EB093_08735 [bacterium]|nr:hypothetical protein [bacterium]
MSPLIEIQEVDGGLSILRIWRRGHLATKTLYGNGHMADFAFQLSYNQFLILNCRVGAFQFSVMIRAVGI